MGVLRGTLKDFLLSRKAGNGGTHCVAVATQFLPDNHLSGFITLVRQEPPSLPVHSVAQGTQSVWAAILTPISVESLLGALVEAFLSLELRPLDKQSLCITGMGNNILLINHWR